jgi:competence protein ComGE
MEAVLIHTVFHQMEILVDLEHSHSKQKIELSNSFLILEGGGFMYKNEKGFTIAEGLVSLGAIIFVATILFPLMFQMIIKLEESKSDLTSYRLMYETTEHLMTSDSIEPMIVVTKGIVYTTNIDISANPGKWKVCVSYENKHNCLTEN